jgi:hypothetical protein
MAVATAAPTTDLTPISGVLDKVEEHRAFYHADRLDGAGSDPMPYAHPMSWGRAMKVARVLHIAANLPAEYLDPVVRIAELAAEAENSGIENEGRKITLLATIVQGLGFDADESLMTPSELPKEA